MSDTALRGAEADTSAVLGIVDGLVTYARANLLLDPRDEDWMRNRMLELFNARGALFACRPTGERASGRCSRGFAEQ